MLGVQRPSRLRICVSAVRQQVNVAIVPTERHIVSTFRFTAPGGDAENAGLENSGPKCPGGKCMTGKRRAMWHGVENGGLENVEA